MKLRMGIGSTPTRFRQNKGFKVDRDPLAIR